MASMQDIRRRIRSVRNTQQITKAMKMVSAAKLRKAQASLLSARPYAEKMREVLGRVASRTEPEAHPLLQHREVKTIGLVLVTANRGLAGGYNANLIRRAVRFVREHEDKEVRLICVGKKGRDYFRRRQTEIIGEYSGLGEEIKFGDARNVSRAIVQFYLNEYVDEVYIIYPRFINAMVQRQTVTRILPVEPAGVEEKQTTTYLYEPSPKAVLSELLPHYVNTVVYHALMEAKASEHGARMAAMDQATENAEEMIKTLTLNLNRARQAAITKEISEITGGAEALK